MAALVDGLVLAAEQVAHEVALHDGEASAVVEVGDGDAGRRGVDEVVGDQRAFEAELGIDGDLAEARARIGDDLDVGRSVAAHGAEGAVGDAVAGDEHAAGAKNVDAVAVLAGAAAVGPDAHDAVGGDDAAVLAGVGAPDLDAVVAAVGNVVVGNFQPRRVDAADGGLDDRVDGAVGDAAGSRR